MKSYISIAAPTQTSPEAFILIEINDANKNIVGGIIPYKDGIIHFGAEGYLNINYKQKVLEVTALSLTQYTYKTLVNGVWTECPLTEDMAVASEILTVLDDRKRALFMNHKNFDYAIHHPIIRTEITDRGADGVVLLSADKENQDDMMDNNKTPDYYELAFTSTYEVFYTDESKQKLMLHNFVLTLGDHDFFTTDEDGDYQGECADHLPAARLHDMTCRASSAVKEVFYALEADIIKASGGYIEVIPATNTATNSGSYLGVSTVEPFNHRNKTNCIYI